MDPDEFIIDYKLVGECRINTALVISTWDKHWFLSQYGEKFTLCHREPGEIKPWLKIQIASSTATVLIKALDLVQTKSTVFVKASSWRRAGEYDGQ